jgi:two-component system, LuxR family, response regulator FixJ
MGAASTAFEPYQSADAGRMLSCPLNRRTSQAETMISHAAPPEQRPLVIIVDDDRAVRSSLRFSLEIEGYAVRTYCDSDELLNGSDLGASSCLVVDHNLPGMNGLEAIAQLRQRRVLVPAILITTHPSAAVRERAAKAAVPIVEKPFLENALLDQIEAALHYGRS